MREGGTEADRLRGGGGKGDLGSSAEGEGKGAFLEGVVATGGGRDSAAAGFTGEILETPTQYSILSHCKHFSVDVFYQSIADFS